MNIQTRGQQIAQLESLRDALEIEIEPLIKKLIVDLGYNKFRDGKPHTYYHRIDFKNDEIELDVEVMTCGCCEGIHSLYHIPYSYFNNPDQYIIEEREREKEREILRQQETERKKKEDAEQRLKEKEERDLAEYQRLKQKYATQGI